MQKIPKPKKINTWSTKLISIFVNMNTSFKNTRLKHNLLISNIIFLRFIFTTLINVILLGQN
jgi:hypothetical protein